MDPLGYALKNYAEYSPQRYLESTHDARVFDIAFDGQALMLASEAWVGTDPMPPIQGQNFRVIFSRYRAQFSGVAEYTLETTDTIDYPGEPALADFMAEEIRRVEIAPPWATIETDAHEIRFRYKSMKLERFAPTLDDFRQ